MQNTCEPTCEHDEIPSIILYYRFADILETGLQMALYLNIISNLDNSNLDLFQDLKLSSLPKYTLAIYVNCTCRQQ